MSESLPEVLTMTSIPADPYPRRYAAMEEALADRKLTAADVKKYVEPFREEIAQDPQYRNALVALSTRPIPLEDGTTAKASFRAKRALRKLVAGAPPPIAPQPPPQPPSVDAVRLSPADSGKTITVRQGQDIVLSFPGGGPPDGLSYRIAGSLGAPARSVQFADPYSNSSSMEQRLSWRTAGEPSRVGKHTITVESGPVGADGRAAVSFTVTVNVVP